MSSVYLKDNLLLKFKNYDLGKKIRDYILDTIDGDCDGNYIRVKGGKKVGSFTYPPDKNTSFLTLCLGDITHMSSSYRYKNFDDTSHITMSYSDIVSGIRTQLKSYNAITASTDYYEPNNIGGPRKDSFIIQEIGNNFKYSISSPVLLDSNLEPITYETNHTLKDNGDGTYEYTKYPNKDLLIKTITGSVNYIDAETVYSDADADGYAYSDEGDAVGSWSTIRLQAEGAGSNSTATSIYSYVSLRVVGSGKIPILKPRIYRGFLYFDLSGIPDGTCTAGELHVYKSGTTVCNNNCEAYIVKGNQGTSLAAASYNDFDGWNGSGFDCESDDCFDYSDDFLDFDDVSQNTHLSWSLNSLGTSDAVKDQSPMEICILMEGDYKNDYNANNGSTGTVGAVIYSSDQSATDKDPYLYLTIDAGIKSRVDMDSGAWDLNSGTITIK